MASGKSELYEGPPFGKDVSQHSTQVNSFLSFPRLLWSYKEYEEVGRNRDSGPAKFLTHARRFRNAGPAEKDEGNLHERKIDENFVLDECVFRSNSPGHDLTAAGRCR